MSSANKNSVVKKFPEGKNGLLMGDAYWEEFYGDGFCIDGDFNAKAHAKYAKAFLDLVDFQVHSLGDFGFGKGNLLYEFQKIFRPKRIIAVEPSLARVENLKKQNWTSKTNIKIYHSTLEEFNPKIKANSQIDLGLCNSVLQYIQDRDLEFVIEKLARLNKLLYVAVPTKNDYIRMRKDLEFCDNYAYERPLKLYRKIFSKHFRFVGFNLLESRHISVETSFEAELFSL